MKEVNSPSPGEVFRLLHIVDGCERHATWRKELPDNRFFRNFLTFSDTDNVKNYYIVPNTDTASLIKSPNKISLSYDRPTKEVLLDIINTAQSINPHGILVSSQFPEMLMESLKRICPNYNFVMHGLVNEQVFTFMPRLASIFNKNWSGYKRYFGYGNVFEKFVKQVVPGANIFLCGLPQMEYGKTLDWSVERQNLLKEFSLPCDKKIVLFVPGGVNNIYHQDYKEYVEQLSSLVKLSKEMNFHLIVKTKQDVMTSWDKPPTPPTNQRILDLYKKDNVDLVKSNKPIYPYLAADVTVVQHTSSVTIECLMLDRNVIDIEYFTSDDYFHMSRFDSLPNATNFNELEYWLSKCLEGNLCEDKNFRLERAELFEKIGVAHQSEWGGISENIIEEISDRYRIAKV